MVHTHVIGKQTMELEMRSSKEAYAAQQRLSELVWKLLVPQMSDLFDALVGEEEMVRLETIEIDLGTIELTQENLLQITNRIIELLGDTCMQSIQEIRTTRYDDTIERKTPMRLPMRNYYFNSWLHWLQKGVLPSHIGKLNEHWLEMVFETLGMEDKAIERLQVMLQRFPLALNRLVLQHKNEDLKSIAELYTGKSQKTLLLFFKELKRFLIGKTNVMGTADHRRLEVALWESVFEWVILKRQKLESMPIAVRLWNHPKLLVLKSTFEALIHRASPAFPVLQKAMEQHAIENLTKVTEEETAAAKDIGLGEAVQKEAVLSNEEVLKDLQFLRNAGLVLLHPFLNRFFEKLGLLEAGTFRDFNCQCKAVLLLHFLSGGNEKVGDHDLVLPKFLCAMPFNLALDHTLRLTATDKKESVALLGAVLDHWGALGSTSPEGLQEGFLQREGKLLKEPSGLKLYVERKTLDILLDRLPWNLSMVKLPWMQEILYVEWN